MTPDKELRSLLRTPCDLQVAFTMEQSPPITAKIIDLSATGMGIVTETRLPKGQIVNFLKKQPKWELPESALIVWSFKHKSGHRAGLEFIAPNN